MPRMPKMTMEWDDMGMNPPKKMKEPKSVKAEGLAWDYENSAFGVGLKPKGFSSGGAKVGKKTKKSDMGVMEKAMEKRGGKTVIVKEKMKDIYPFNLAEEAKKKAMDDKKKREKQLEEAKKDAKAIVPPKIRKARSDKGVKRQPRKKKDSSSSMTKEDGQSGQGYNPPPSTY